MQIYIPSGSLPTQQQLDDAQTSAVALSTLVQAFTLNLSAEQRTNSYRMGPRRYAYAKTAERIGQQYENAMPRQFVPTDFTGTINLIERLQTLKSIVAQLEEQLDDTLMAARIDAMTYTKQVHDSLKMANVINPAYDTPLRELDDFNARAAAEETTPASTTPTPDAATPPPPSV
jgi:hypothetical protein